MERTSRLITAALVAVATFYFVGLVLPTVWWVDLAVAAGAATLASRWAWRRAGEAPADRGEVRSYIGLGAVMLGSVGFLAGFIGPIVLELGTMAPIFGIFVTGPLGLLLGAGLGAIVNRRGVDDAVAVRFLRRAAMVEGVVIMLMLVLASLSGEHRVGYLLDLTPTGCQPATEAVPEAIASWERSFEMLPAWNERPGWRDDIPRMSAETPGVKLEVDLHRNRTLSVRNRPFRRAELVAGDWSRGRTVKRWYFVPVASGGCDGIPLGERRIAYVKAGGGGGRAPDPPTTLPGFLRLGVLRDVPPAYLVYTDRGPDSP